jgi:hypothetical protein
VWTLGAVLLVALVAVGVLAWRSFALSDEANKLSDKVDKLSDEVSDLSYQVTEQISALFLETADPWGGSFTDYQSALGDVLLVRDDLLEKRNNAGSLPTTEATAVQSHIDALAGSVMALPESPPAVRKAQDDYRDGLLELSAAALDVLGSDTQSNVDKYYHAWTAESWLFQAWMQEYERSKYE